MTAISTHKTPLYFSIPLSVSILISSLCGIFITGLYSRETVNWRTQGVGQDIMNLILIPILLISANQIRKQSRTALFIWIGSMFYLIYAFFIYAFAIHFNALFLVYCANLGISAYAIIAILYQTDIVEIQDRFNKSASFKEQASFLIGIALLFALLWLKDIIPALLNGSIPQTIVDAGTPVNPVHVLDLSLCLPAFFVGAVLLLKKHPVSYLLVPSLLVFAVIMAVSIAVLIIYMKIKGVTDDIFPVYLMAVLGGISTIMYLKMITQLDTEEKED